MPKQESENKSGKGKVEIQFDIKVSPEAVWKALTDAEELTRWHALDAQVTPGVGGAISPIWDSRGKDSWPISIWEPNKRLRALWCKPDVPEAELFGVDYFIEDLGGGSTRVRLVHFGFSHSAKRQDMYDGISFGWDELLWALKEYLEKHLGRPRCVIHLLGVSAAPFEEIWPRIFSPQGLFSENMSDATPGSRFTFRAGTEEFNGVVRKASGTDFYFQGIIENLNNALLRVEGYTRKDEGNIINLSIGTFDIAPARLQKIEQAVVAQLAHALGSTVKSDDLGK